MDCEDLLSKYSSYLNYGCTFDTNVMFLIGVCYFLSFLLLVYQLFRSANKSRLISKPNPNVPWIETYCIHTLYIVRLVQILLVASIWNCVYSLLLILYGSKYTETFLWFWTTDDCNNMRTIYSWNLTNILYVLNEIIT